MQEIRALLAIGSNIGAREENLKKAVSGMSAFGKIDGIAPLYESDPYGVWDQPRFLNSAFGLITSLSAAELLAALKGVEGTIGRKRRRRWGPREIDIDIIFYGQGIVDEHALKIPHPDFRNRRFVLQPLADLHPSLLIPGTAETLREAFAACPDPSILTLVKESWWINDIEC